MATWLMGLAAAMRVMELVMATLPMGLAMPLMGLATAMLLLAGTGDGDTIDGAGNGVAADGAGDNLADWPGNGLTDDHVADDCIAADAADDGDTDAIEIVNGKAADGNGIALAVAILQTATVWRANGNSDKFAGSPMPNVHPWKGHRQR
eukprot:412526-Pleurochrysis_carterae.AAC.2